MEETAQKLREDVSSAFHQLAKEHPQFGDARMLVGASEATASLQKQITHRTVDMEWIQKIEDTLPYLDMVTRNPTVTIQDVEEVTPVDLARNISEKSIRHLAQHSNLIQKVEGDQVTPSKILNIFREESLLTYENRFVNTLLKRLLTFVTLRYRVICQGFGTQQSYTLDYHTHFSHPQNQGSTNVKMDLHLSLDSPLTENVSQEELESNANYAQHAARVEQLYHTVASYANSGFVKRMGNNYIRPPVMRTNAIIKNKNMKVCLELWEYLDSCRKAGFAELRDARQELPSDAYIRELYSSVALQYVQFYNGVLQDQAAAKLLEEKHLPESTPDFQADAMQVMEEEFTLLDSQYQKVIPLPRKMDAPKKLSMDELKIRQAVEIAIRADQAIEAERKRLEEEERRRKAEEEARRKAAEEAERKRREEEEARRLAEAEAERQRKAEEEARRLEEIRLQKEAEERRIQEEKDAALMAEEMEALRLAAIEEAQIQKEKEAIRLQKEAAEQKRLAQETLVREQKEAAERLYYHSRQEYVTLPRKKKKKIQMDLHKLHEYEAALLKKDGSPLPAPPAGRDWDEIRRWERSVMPQNKK